MRKIIAIALALALSSAASASGPKMSNSGGIGSAASTYSGSPLEVSGGTYSINGTTGNFLASGGASTSVDLTASTASGYYTSGAGSVFSYFPSVGNDPGDHQRAQQLVRFYPVQDGPISEAGLSLDGVINHGYMATYANSTAYSANQYILNVGLIYKAAASCSSAASGGGPTGTGSSIADGACSFAYQAHGQANAKMGIFSSFTAGTNAGNVWAGVYDLVLTSGWHQGFASGVEIDLQNNSGTDCASCQTLFLTGDAGANKIGTYLSIFNPDAVNFAAVNGIATAGPKTVSNSDASFATSGTYSIIDTGVHTVGLNLAGAYSAAAVNIPSDNAQIRMRGTSGTNLRVWRIISNIAGSSDGALTIQHTTDNFVSSFTNLMVGNTDGSAAFGGPVQVSARTFATLPTCNAGAAGYMAYITDSSAAITAWNQAVTAGGGANKAFISCNGSGWFAFNK